MKIRSKFFGFIALACFAFAAIGCGGSGGGSGSSLPNPDPAAQHYYLQVQPPIVGAPQIAARDGSAVSVEEVDNIFLNLNPGDDITFEDPSTGESWMIVAHRYTTDVDPGRGGPGPLNLELRAGGRSLFFKGGTRLDEIKITNGTIAQLATGHEEIVNTVYTMFPPFMNSQDYSMAYVFTMRAVELRTYRGWDQLVTWYTDGKG